MQWHRSHRYRLGAAAIAAAILVAGVFAYLRAQTTDAQNQRRQRPAATVGVATASRADIPITLDALGTVTPLATVIVRPQVSGILTEVRFREGDTMDKGATLAVIDERPFRLALDQAIGQQRRDEAQLALARLQLKRDQTLLTQDSIAQQDVDTQAAMVSEFEAAVVTDRAAVGTARLNLEYTQITAPVAGQVGLRAVDVGNIVSTTDTTGIATITQIQPIDVVFTLPADQIVTVQQRLSAGAKLTATVLDRTLTTTLGQGAFLTLDNQVDAQTGTVRAKARFDNADRRLFPNQFVNVRLLIDTLHGATAVPSSAVHQGPQGDYVWVLSKDRSVHLRSVRRGPAANELIAVQSGLKVGEQVVTEGADRLTDGALVQLPNGPRAHKAPPG